MFGSFYRNKIVENPCEQSDIISNYSVLNEAEFDEK